ncbi:hypothetical protein VWM68_11510, partial [Campylobacter coli]
QFYTPANIEIKLNNQNVSRETIKVNSSNYICQNSKAAKEFAKKREILEQIAKAFDIAKSELDNFIASISNLKSTKKELSLDE